MPDLRFNFLKILLSTMSVAHGEGLIAPYEITIVAYLVVIINEET